MASAGVVALIPPSEEMQAAGRSDTTGGYIRAWVDMLCAEDSQEERDQWYALVYGAGYRSFRRLRNMTDPAELVELGLPLVVARVFVQQAQRMHGQAVLQNKYPVSVGPAWESTVGQQQ